MAAVTCRFPRDSYTDSCTFAMSVCLSVCFSVCPCMLLCVYVYVRTCSCPSCCVPAWVRSTSAWRRGTGRCSWSDSAAHAWQQWAPEVHVEAVECCVCVCGGGCCTRGGNGRLKFTLKLLNLSVCAWGGVTKTEGRHAERTTWMCRIGYVGGFGLKCCGVEGYGAGFWGVARSGTAAGVGCIWRMGVSVSAVHHGQGTCATQQQGAVHGSSRE